MLKNYSYILLFFFFASCKSLSEPKVKAIQEFVNATEDYKVTIFTKPAIDQQSATINLLLVDKGYVLKDYAVGNILVGELDGKNDVDLLSKVKVIWLDRLNIEINIPTEFKVLRRSKNEQIGSDAFNIYLLQEDM